MNAMKDCTAVSRSGLPGPRPLFSLSLCLGFGLVSGLWGCGDKPPEQPASSGPLESPILTGQAPEVPPRWNPIDEDAPPVADEDAPPPGQAPVKASAEAKAPPAPPPAVSGPVRFTEVKPLGAAIGETVSFELTLENTDGAAHDCRLRFAAPDGTPIETKRPIKMTVKAGWKTFHWRVEKTFHKVQFKAPGQMNLQALCQQAEGEKLVDQAPLILAAER